MASLERALGFAWLFLKTIESFIGSYGGGYGHPKFSRLHRRDERFALATHSKHENLVVAQRAAANIHWPLYRPSWSCTIACVMELAPNHCGRRHRWIRNAPRAHMDVREGLRLHVSQTVTLLRLRSRVDARPPRRVSCACRRPSGIAAWSPLRPNGQTIIRREQCEELEASAWRPHWRWRIARRRRRKPAT